MMKLKESAISWTAEGNLIEVSLYDKHRIDLSKKTGIKRVPHTKFKTRQIIYLSLADLF